MDDIFFTRKKNSGETPQETPRQTPSGISETNADNGVEDFRLNFNRSVPGDNPPEPAKTYGNPPSDSVFSGGYTPYVPKYGKSDTDFTPPDEDMRTPEELRFEQIKQHISEFDRIPEELRAGEEEDYFESRYGAGAKSEPEKDEASTQVDEPVRRPKKKKNKMKAGQRAVIAVLLIILICLFGSGAYALSVLGKLNYDTNGLEPNQYLAADGITLKSDESVKNILFIGCDDANGAQFSRSDTMMLVSIDKAHKAIKLTSFLRDSYLYIPGRDCKAKINSACTFGGPQFVVDALEYNFEVDIEHYVMVDFKMFINIVNALGGIDVDIEEDEAEFLNRTCGNFKGKAVTGMNHLNGLQALDYCRIRKLDSDFYRTLRQRKVISQIIAKTKSASVFNLFGQLDTILQYVETDIPKNELIGLGAGAITSYLRYDIMQERMPYGDNGGSWYYDTTSGGESIIRVDVYDNTEHIQNFIYNTSPEDVTESEE